MKATGKQEGGTILVPVDYSDYSINACRYAAKIAVKSGSKLVLFHAFYSPAFDLIELTGGIQTQQNLRADVTEKLIEGETEELKKFIKSLSQLPEFKQLPETRISHELKAGIAKDEIVFYSSEINPELVVMGTRGADKKAASILGSITENTIKKLNVPVLAIPEDYKFVGEDKLQHIVYLTDFDESDFVSIQKLMKFTELFDMTIHCLHIGDLNEQWESLKMEGLKDYFNKIYKKKQVQCHILDKKPDLLQSLDKYINENNINLLSLTHRKRKLIEKIFNPSMTKKIFYHAEIPLMVFHS